MVEEFFFENINTISGQKIMTIQITNNNPNGFKIGIYSNNGKLKLADSYANSLNAIESIGRAISYTFSIVDTPIGVLGTNLPKDMTDISMKTTSQFIFFNTGVKQATFKKNFDIYIKLDPDKIRCLLSKENYDYYDNIHINISDL